jgi:hypothetical protein
MNLKIFNKEHGYNFKESDYNFLVGDIEASINENNEFVFELIIIYDGYGIYSFKSIHECINFLEEYDTKIKLYFHNLDFDMIFFFKAFLKEKIIDKPLIGSGSLTIAFEYNNVVFCNSLTLFPMSLKKIVSKFLHVKDLEWEEDKTNVLELKGKELEKYCTLDVIYLHNAITKLQKYFSENYEIESLPLTIPSLSMRVWKNKFIEENEDFIHISRRNNFFRDNYYYGGHTEKFIEGQYIFRNVRYYDVNSLYPYIMRDMNFIDSKLKRVRPTKQKLKSLVEKNSLFFCEITLNVDREELRFFPTKEPDETMSYYLFGEIRIKVSEIGIKFILKYGSFKNIVKVHSLLVGYEEKSYKPFFEYVSLFYRLRKEDEGNDTIYKLLLNSLYGKFGQREEFEEKIINSTSNEMPKRINKFRDMFISVYDKEIPFYQKNTLRLDIAGKITEGARLYMGDIINHIRINKGKVIYTDTDSIITDYELEKKFLSENELGKLSDEIGYRDSFICLGQKMYHFYKSGKKATKGVKKMSLEDFRDYIRGKRKYENESFSKFGMYVNKGFHGIIYRPYEIRVIRERLDKKN